MQVIRAFRAALTVATVGGLALAAVPAAQAAAVPGARYDGIGGSPKQHQFLTVAKGGTALGRYVVYAGGRCSDGRRFGFIIDQRREARVAVGGDGSFTKAVSSRRYTTTRRGKRFTGSLAIGFTGSFSADGNAVAVTVNGSFRASGLRCSGSETTTLNRDGTPGAPLANERFATQRYAGTRAGAVEIGAFRGFAPASEVRGFTVRYRASCAGGARYRNRFSIGQIVLSPKATLDAPDAYRGRTGDGYRYRARDRLRLRFFKKAGAYRYAGSYTLRIAFYRKGKLALRCRVPTTRFSG